MQVLRQLSRLRAPDSNAHFFAQMDHLTPHLLRVLQPGRVAAIHVKDRIVPGGMTERFVRLCTRFTRTASRTTRGTASPTWG